MNKVVWTISLVPAMVYLGGRRRMGKRMEHVNQTIVVGAPLFHKMSF